MSDTPAPQPTPTPAPTPAPNFERPARFLEAAGIGLFLGVLAVGIWQPWKPAAATGSAVRDDTGVAKLGPSAVTTPSGLRYEDLVVGTGPSPRAGQTVIVHYRGRLTNGTEFDGSRNRGEPFRFALGQSQVIKGWDEGVATMKIGGARRLVVPPDLGYGSQSAPGGKIPANSTLVFEVELLGVE